MQDIQLEPSLGLDTGLLSLSGGRQLLLDDASKTWQVQSGAVEIYCVRYRDGELAGNRHHLATVEAGQIIFGLNSPALGEGMALIAVGIVATKLQEIPLSNYQNLAQADDRSIEIARQLEEWLSNLTRGLMKDVLRPKMEVILEAATDTITVPVGKDVSTKKGLLWVELNSQAAGRSLLNGEEELEATVPTYLFPLHTTTWLRAAEADLTLRAVDTETAMAEAGFWDNLAVFYQTFFRFNLTNLSLVNFDEINRLREKVGYDRVLGQRALSSLASIITEGAKPDNTPNLLEASQDPLLAACRLVGDAMGLTIRKPVEKEEPSQNPSRVREIAYASRFKMRTIMLSNGWWTTDNGPLLAFTKPELHPVALIPLSENSYEMVNPADNTRVRVDEAVSKKVVLGAFCFYRPFPEQALRSWELIKFGLRGCGKDVRRTIVMGAAVSGLALLVPFLTGQLFDSVIPGGDRQRLLQFFLALVVAAIGSAMFQVVRSLSVLRLESRLDFSIQAAIWDRLLSLPAGFFHKHTAGDLAERAMGINRIRQLVSGSVINAALSCIFSVFNFALLFMLDAGLAIVAAAIVLVTLLTMVGFSLRQLRYQRQTATVQGKLSGTVIQLISGISKLRVAGAEVRAFALWAKLFTEQKRVAYRAKSTNNGLLIFNAAWPVITTMVIFGAISFSPGQVISTGVFMAFTMAFTQFLTAIIGLAAAFDAILQSLTIFERAAPIFQTAPEVDEAKTTPGELNGGIEINQVSFRYNPDGPLVLDGVSIKAEPGEFVAIVGPSGSGKSSLFRLLLGFENPEAGSIYYDDQDMAGLNLPALRHQLGVVIQHAKLMPGSIFENIVGSAPLTVKDALEAAHMAGFDEDIRGMPMGMFTMLSESGGGLSGGQRQRLIIARAIVNKPRVMLFDEATSALDNRTQAIVSKSLENLQATRIVIAHRLSTIINADRIYVLQAGKVVQSGTYADLVAQPGPFQELAARQLA